MTHWLRFFFSYLLIYIALTGFSPMTEDDQKDLKANFTLSKGDVTFIGGGQSLKPDLKGVSVRNLESVQTGVDGYAHFEIEGVAMIKMKPGSLISFSHPDPDEGPPYCRIKVQHGQVYFELFENGEYIHSATPNTMVSGFSTTFIVQVNENGSTHFTGVEGQSSVTAAYSGETRQLHRRNRISTDLQGQYFTIRQLGGQEMEQAVSGFVIVDQN